MAKLDRYNRNMAQEGITLEMQEKLITSSVLVMGVGSLGSGVVMNLAAMGVGKMMLIDSGVIEVNDFNSQIIHKEKNLQRAKVMSAKDWVQEFNPDIKVEILKMRVDEFNYFSAIQDYDIIVDCFDSMASKYMLNEIAHRHKKTLIYGYCKAFSGEVTTIVPNKTGCLNCIKPKPADFRENFDSNFATLSPVINTIAAIQSNEVLKLITGKGTPLLNRLLTYDGLTSDFRTYSYSANVICDICSEKKQEEVPQVLGFDTFKF